MINISIPNHNCLLFACSGEVNMEMARQVPSSRSSDQAWKGQIWAWLLQSSSRRKANIRRAAIWSPSSSWMARPRDSNF